MVRPLLVDALGRSGSTLLMELLGTSPRIAFDRSYPFEQFWYRYLLATSRTIVGRATASAEWDNSSLLRDGGTEAAIRGAPPWAGGDLAPDAERFFGALWATFAEQLPEGSLYYAEKSPNARAIVHFPSLSPVQITVVRDPRDQWLSILAFDKRRGNYGFGRFEGEDVAAYRQRMLGLFRDRLEYSVTLLEANERGFYRYEDLMENTGRVADDLTELLDVALDPKRITQRRDHITAKRGAKGSVGRWRREMSAEERQFFADHLGPLLDRVGYEV
jgi:Sulfotransferase family